MLTEAYTVQLLKESIPTMSLTQVYSNLDLMSESELEYVATVSERLLEGFFGNLGAGLKGVAKGAGQAVQQAGQGLANKTSQAVQGAKQVGSGLAAAGKQVIDNTKDIYNTGADTNRANDSIEKARGLTQQLIDLVTQAQQKGFVKAQGAITDMTLSDLVDTLETAKQSAGTFAQGALNKGFTGGVKSAFNSGFQS
jgi:hypothetical protein